MESFRTLVAVNPPGFSVSHAHKVLLIGSCFTEYIGLRLQKGKFPCRINPFGIVYNPVSIGRCLDRLLDGNRPFREAELVQRQDLWHSWEHHGHFSGQDSVQTLEHINSAYRDAVQFLGSCDRLLLSLGTATVYRLRESGSVVANCHKAPTALFDKNRLSEQEVVDALFPALSRLKAALPGLRVVLTVSPVRHWRDGAVENQRSKAALLLACAELEARLPDTVYFPAYEMLLDDLRDYRFYDADMLHPSAVAIEYIWSKFAGAFFEPATKHLLEQIGKIAAAAAHRPFRPDTPRHREFQAQQLEAIWKLETQYPELDFTLEKAVFEI